jgi:hypothetical protein
MRELFILIGLSALFEAVYKERPRSHTASFAHPSGSSPSKWKGYILLCSQCAMNKAQRELHAFPAVQMGMLHMQAAQLALPVKG